MIAAVIALTLAGLLLWKKKAPKIATLFFLVAGAGLTGGHIGHWTDTVVGWLAKAVSKITMSAAGVAVPYVLVIILGFVVIHDLWKGNKSSRTTMACAFFLPVALAIMPGPIGESGRTVVAAITGTTSDAVDAAIKGS